MSRRESYIASQFGSISIQFQNLFDELGLTSEERDERKRRIYSVIAEAMEKYVSDVTHERDEVLNECLSFQQSLQEMVSALKDVDSLSILGQNSSVLNNSIEPPYNPLLESLKVAHSKLEKVFADRLEKVNQLLENLKYLATKIDGISVPAKIMPARSSDIESLNLSNEHINELEQEVTRWQQEKQSRVIQVAEYASQIVNLWAELGTPQDEISGDILNNYKNDPESLGIMTADLDRLLNLRKSLQQQKDSRIETLTNYKKDVTHLWAKLSEDTEYSDDFEKSNRGISTTVLENYRLELVRLNEKKRQHINVFIQDARQVLQDLWDKLYMSEEESALFTPAWADIYTDASLDAHESEIERLQTLLEERKPVLSLLESYREIQRDEQELQASMHDASRLLSKGPGRRDPGRLLKEEQMRKRIAKRKPKILQDLKDALLAWEEKSGKSFKINGQDFLDVVAEEEARLPKSAVSRRGPTTAAATTTTTTTITTAPRKPPVASISSITKGRVSPIKPKVIINNAPPSTRRAIQPQSNTKSRPVINGTTTNRPQLSPPKSTLNTTNLQTSSSSIRSPTRRGLDQGTASRLGARSPVRPAYNSTNTREQTRLGGHPVGHNHPPPLPPSFTSVPSISRLTPSPGKENRGAVNNLSINPVKILPHPQYPNNNANYNPQTRVVSSTSSTTSSENWETYDETSSSEDEDSEKYDQWRKGALKKLAASAPTDNDITITSSTVINQPTSSHSRISEFNWEKDTF